MKYYLNREELKTLVKVHQLLDINGFSDKPEFPSETTLLKPMVEKNSELRSLYQEFLNHKETLPYKNFYSSQCRAFPIEKVLDLFSDKLEVSMIGDLLFNWQNPYSYSNSKEEIKEWFKDLHVKTPSFLLCMHNYVKNNQSVKSIVYDSYLQFIKKHDFLPINEVVNNLNKFSIKNLTDYKKRLNTYLSILPSNEETFNIIIKKFSKEIKSNAVFKNYFETKLELFSKSVQNEYKNKFENKAILFNENLFYGYQFDLSVDAIVSKFKLGNKKANEFINNLYIRIEIYTFNYTKENYPNEKQNFSSDIKDKKLIFHCASEEMRQHIKTICQTASEHLNVLYENINEYMQIDQETFDDIIKKSMQAKKLEIDLSEKTKGIKSKI